MQRRPLYNGRFELRRPAIEDKIIAQRIINKPIEKAVIRNQVIFNTPKIPPKIFPLAPPPFPHVIPKRIIRPPQVILPPPVVIPEIPGKLNFLDRFFNWINSFFK